MIITEIQEILVNLRERLKPSRQKRQQTEQWPLYKAAIKRISCHQDD